MAAKSIYRPQGPPHLTKHCPSKIKIKIRQNGKNKKEFCTIYHLSTHGCLSSIYPPMYTVCLSSIHCHLSTCVYVYHISTCIYLSSSCLRMCMSIIHLHVYMSINLRAYVYHLSTRVGLSSMYLRMYMSIIDLHMYMSTIYLRIYISAIYLHAYMSIICLSKHVYVSSIYVHVYAYLCVCVYHLSTYMCVYLFISFAPSFLTGTAGGPAF